MKRLIAFTALFVVPLLLLATSTLSEKSYKIIGYEIDGNQVRFSFSDSTAMLMELYSEGIVKVWIDPEGTFERNNESYAVLPETSQNDINLS